MKKLAKSIIAKLLWAQVKKLRQKNDFKVIAVAGSIGKTSTKLAIANLLGAGLRVRHQDGNYNDLVSVPFVFFDLMYLPNIFNPFSWLAVFMHNRKVIKTPYPYDIVVVELGTDGPGQLKEFVRYLEADIGVLTAIAPEHMEFFADLDAVASEELALANISTKLIANKDLCAPQYLSQVNIPLKTYAINQTADLQITNATFVDQKSSFDINFNGQLFLKASHELVSDLQLYSVAAASLVAVELGLDAKTIEQGLRSISPVSGRMQRLAGYNGSVIIDDTYNASPQAVKAALDTLYRLKASQKIAILGNMNELGAYSEQAHKEAGGYCDSKQLSLVVTIGPDANKFLAASAKAKGCKVESFSDPYAAGEYIKPLLQEGTVLLAKGSQNKVFAEETVKLLLAKPEDSNKLVRQSKQWLETKKKAFNR